MAGRFLSLFKPVGRVLPEIKKPERKVSFNEKIFWTALVLVVFLVMTEIPLYGVATGQADNFGALRVIFASNRGTLMELGIGPIVTAGLILQLLVGSSIIQCDMSNPEDRGLFTSASKVFSIVLTGIQAGAYIISGMYGALSGPTILVIFLQLISAGIIVMLMDELVQKGWGLGSGISLFIMAGVAQNILWSTFSPPTGLFVGSLSQLLNGQQTLFDWVFGAAGGVYPSLIGFIATIGVFMVVIYLEGIRVELPMSYAGYKGFRSRYPIKLLYVSNLPVIFASALFANVYFFSQLLWSQLGRPQPGTNLLFQIIGDYSYNATSGSITSVGGLAYLVTAPHSIQNVASDPLRAAAYLGIIVGFCAVFSLIWLEVGGLGPAKVAQQLMDSGMQIPGYRRSGRPIEAILKRYIPVVTVLGGIIVGLVAGLSDFLGVFGSGTGILLSVGIIYQYYELLMRERAAEMFPAFRRILGE
ncbi:MAG: preprotein translocase subunit SecY [Candidatus Bathyarchaeota archaeon]|nr:preprotein translocase subunit SecY [Candidatus Bathyarchaeota archaeon]